VSRSVTGLTKYAEVQSFARKIIKYKLVRVMLRAGSKRMRNASPHTGEIGEGRHGV
jgi:hypothetical protein